MQLRASEQLTWAVIPVAALATAAAGGPARASAAPTQRPNPPHVRAFKPVADAYVTAAEPRANFGSARMLRIDGVPMTTTYVRFDLDRLRREPESVTLLLHSNRSTRTPFEVRRVNENDWRERRITFANAPDLSLRYASSKPVRAGRWAAVDVTAFARDDEVSLAITTRSSRGVSFGSRESRYGPRLAVVLRRDGDPGQLNERLRRK